MMPAGLTSMIGLPLRCPLQSDGPLVHAFCNTQPLQSGWSRICSVLAHMIWAGECSYDCLNALHTLARDVRR